MRINNDSKKVSRCIEYKEAITCEDSYHFSIHGNIEVLQAMRLLQVNSIKLSITTVSSDFI